MTPDLSEMLYHCQGKQAGPLSCVAAVAAALPAGSKLRAAHETFEAMPAAQKRRAAGNPLASARYVARKLRCRPAPVCGAPAWGIVEGQDGLHVFAMSTGGAWFARSALGVTRVHRSRVLKAWEIV